MAMLIPSSSSPLNARPSLSPGAFTQHQTFSGNRSSASQSVDSVLVDTFERVGQATTRIAADVAHGSPNLVQQMTELMQHRLQFTALLKIRKMWDDMLRQVLDMFEPRAK